MNSNKFILNLKIWTKINWGPSHFFFNSKKKLKIIFYEWPPTPPDGRENGYDLLQPKMQHHNKREGSPLAVLER